MRRIVSLLFIVVFLIGCAEEKTDSGKTYVVDERKGIPMETDAVGESGSEETNLDRFEKWQREKEARDKLEWREKGLHNEIEDSFISLIGKGEDALTLGNVEDAKSYIKEADKLVEQNEFLEDSNANKRLENLRLEVDKKD